MARLGKDAGNEKTSASGNGFLVFLLIFTWSVVGGGGYFLYLQFWEPSQLRIFQLEQRVDRLSVNSSENLAKLKEDISEDVEAALAKVPEPELNTSVVDIKQLPKSGKEEVIRFIAEPNRGNSKFQAIDVESMDVGLSDVSERTEMLEEKLYSLAKQLEENHIKSNEATLVIAAVNLRDAIKAGKSYQNELNTLKKVSGKDLELQSQLESLESKAESGIEHYSYLKLSFSDIAQDVVNKSRKDKENPNLLDKATSYFSNVVSVRKIGEVAGDNIEAKIARAEGYINKNELEQAIVELESIETIEKLDEWLEEARAYNNIIKTSHNIFNYISGNAALEAIESDSQ